MGITTGEAKEEILEDLANAIEQIALAAGRLGDAYELLPSSAADRLETELFRPTQKALGRSKRAHAHFAEQSGIAPRSFEPPAAGARSQGVKGFLEQALTAAADGERRIAALQDSALPTEFGDPELRAGLSEVRALLATVPGAAREFLRTLGR